jgi:hypothetical protein
MMNDLNRQSNFLLDLMSETHKAEFLYLVIVEH